MYIMYAYNQSFEKKLDNINSSYISDNFPLIKHDCIFVNNRFDKYSDMAKDIFFESHYMVRANKDEMMDLDFSISVYNINLMKNYLSLGENNNYVLKDLQTGVSSYVNSFKKLLNFTKHNFLLEKFFKEKFIKMIKVDA